MLSDLQMWQAETRQMLRSKFWSGLTNERVKDAIRHHYEAGKSFEDLLVEARAREDEFSRDKSKGKAIEKASVKGAAAQPMNSDTIATQLKGLLEQMKQITTRLDKLEKGKSYFKSSSSGNFNFKPSINQSQPKPAGQTKSAGQTTGPKRCYKCQSPDHLANMCPN